MKGIKSSPCNRLLRPRQVVEVLLYSFFNLGDRWWWLVRATSQPLFTRQRNPVPVVQEAGWIPVPVWTGAVNLVPTGIRSPDLAARSTLYRLRYPGPYERNKQVRESSKEES
jgi:hypothetical protein